MSPDHGVTRYVDYGCRCPVCRAANAERHRQLRHGDRPTGPRRNHVLDHGTRSTYVNHGCRCEACVEAQRAAYRRRPSRAQSGGS